MNVASCPRNVWKKWPQGQEASGLADCPQVPFESSLPTSEPLRVLPTLLGPVPSPMILGIYRRQKLGDCDFCLTRGKTMAMGISGVFLHVRDAGGAALLS